MTRTLVAALAAISLSCSSSSTPRPDSALAFVEAGLSQAPCVPPDWDTYPVVCDTRVLDQDRTVDGLLVTESGTLIFDPDASVTLQSTENVLVRGRLVMRPSSSAVEHVLRFVDVDEDAFQGGGMQVLDSDVGLWVTGEGILDARGHHRRGWARHREDMHGWLPTDELVSAPQGTVYADPWEPRRRFRLDFPVYALGTPVPERTYGPRTLPTEVINLTRNVRIEGTPEGRAHVMFLMCDRPQVLDSIELRHLSPPGVDGRYALHFHHCRDGSRGSRIVSVLARDFGGRGFVPHASHGIALVDTVAYDFHETGAIGYWWDPDDDETYPANATHDALWFRAAAFRFGNVRAFVFGQGDGNACIECVGAGSNGTGTSSVFAWPGHTVSGPLDNPRRAWRFEHAVAHNARVGIFTWTNQAHDISLEAPVVYDTDFGIYRGAYTTNVQTRDAFLADNVTHLFLRATANTQHVNLHRHRTVRVETHGGRVAVSLGHHNAEPSMFEEVADLAMHGPEVAIEVDQPPHLHPSLTAFVRPLLDGQPVTPADFVFLRAHPDTVLLLEDVDRTASQWTPQTGWVPTADEAASQLWP